MVVRWFGIFSLLLHAVFTHMPGKASGLICCQQHYHFQDTSTKDQNSSKLSSSSSSAPYHPSTEDLAGPADVQPLVPEKRPTSSAQQPAVLNTICVQTRGLRCFGYYEASASRHFFTFHPVIVSHPRYTARHQRLSLTLKRVTLQPTLT